MQTVSRADITFLRTYSNRDLDGYLKPLWLVYRIRVICREEGTTSFTSPAIAKKLNDKYGMDIPRSTLQKHLDQVNELFASHFKIGGFSLFDSAPKVGYEFIQGDEDIDAAWDLIERVGRTMEQLPIARPGIAKHD